MIIDWRIHKGHWPLHVRARRLLDHFLEQIQTGQPGEAAALASLEEAG